MTFCQSAENHATVAAGSSVAATEIDSNKYRERKRKGGEIGQKEGEEEEETAKGERKTKDKGEEGKEEEEKKRQNGNRTARAADAGWVVTSQGWMWIANTGNKSPSSVT